MVTIAGSLEVRILPPASLGWGWRNGRRASTVTNQIQFIHPNLSIAALTKSRCVEKCLRGAGSNPAPRSIIQKFRAGSLAEERSSITLIRRIKRRWSGNIAAFGRWVRIVPTSHQYTPEAAHRHTPVKRACEGAVLQTCPLAPGMR